MTLILSRISRFDALQVADRLISTDKTTHDNTSNKSIVLVARDGILALSYSGLAYLEGIPTDQWLAEKLTGFHYDRGRKPWLFQPGPHINARRDVGWLLKVIQSALADALRRMTPGSRQLWKAYAFHLIGCGWQWTDKGHHRPVVMLLGKQKGTEDVEVVRKPRHWYVNPLTRVSVTPTPPDYFRDEGLRTFAEGSGAYSIPDALEGIVGQIRAIASRNPRVGRDCISIVMSPPYVGQVHVRYHANDVKQATTMIGGSSVLVDLAFTPWIVTPGGTYAPSISYGSHVTTLQVGGFRVFLHPVNAEAPIQVGHWATCSYMGGQRRIPPPRS